MFLSLEPNKNWLVYDNNPSMYQKCVDLTFPLTPYDIKNISRMISYIDASYYNHAEKYHIKPGIGIAGNQIGYNKKVFYIHLDQDDVEYQLLLANAKIVKTSVNNMYLKNGEGCLSVKKDHKGYSVRKAFIFVDAIDVYTEKKVSLRMEKLLAACMQHEIDHTNNIFYYERINTQNPFHCEKEWVAI